MGVTATKNVKEALVYYDAGSGVSGGNRWYDAYGSGVVKYLQEFVALAVDDATHDPLEFTNILLETGGGGDSTAIVTDLGGGALLITTDNAVGDGYKMQLGHGHAGVGENIDLSGAYPLYFGIEFAINDVDKCGCLFGVCITDTSCHTAVSDGIYFRSASDAGTLRFIVEKNNSENDNAATTLTDNTYVTAEFYYDGTNVMAYIDGSLVATVAATNASFPDDELMRLTMEFLTGETTANTCTIKWVRMIHIRPRE